LVTGRQAQFIALFWHCQGEAGRTIALDASGNKSLMPWTMYADLVAIYVYLMASEARNN
jgi:hypothetical protein